MESGQRGTVYAGGICRHLLVGMLSAKTTNSFPLPVGLPQSETKRLKMASKRRHPLHMHQATLHQDRHPESLGKPQSSYT